jgi:hypothetical protein
MRTSIRYTSVSYADDGHHGLSRTMNWTLILLNNKQNLASPNTILPTHIIRRDTITRLNNIPIYSFSLKIVIKIYTVLVLTYICWYGLLQRGKFCSGSNLHNSVYGNFMAASNQHMSIVYLLEICKRYICSTSVKSTFVKHIIKVDLFNV